MEIIANSKKFRLVLFDSGKPGSTVCIVGGVHGDEHCGLNAISLLEKKLIEIKLLRGRLLTLMANLEAVRLQRRFVDFDLNRAFGNPDFFGYESQLVKSFTPHLIGIDYLLDLHSTSAPTKPFCAGTLTETHLQMFQMTGLEVYTHGWEVHRGYTMLIDEVNRLGGIGLIVECGKTGDSQTDQIAYHTAVRFLQGLKMLSAFQLPPPESHTIVRIEDTIKAKTEKFIFTRHFENLNPVEASEVVAYDNGQPVAYPHEFLMAMPSQGKLLAGDEAFGVGIIERIYSA